MIQLLIRDPKQLKPVKILLEENNWLNKSRKIENNDGVFSVFTLLTDLADGLLEFDHCFYTDTPPSKRTLKSVVQEYCHAKREPLVFEVPKKWSIYPPMILFNANIEQKHWPRELCEKVLEHQSELFGTSGITHLAVNRPIVQTDVMRRPFNIVPLYGDFGPDLAMDHRPTSADFQDAFWCHVVQNGVYQTWAPRYTMFSRGNIKEKKRILDNCKNLQGNIVVDYYCGIGYFALSYLRNGAKVLCWDINPWSIEGFRRALSHAGYRYKIYHRDSDVFKVEDLSDLDACVFLESNEFIHSRLASVVAPGSLNIKHVNLGLLPTSRPSWQSALSLVREKSTTKATVHVHENVHVDDFEELKEEISAAFGGSHVTHLEKVKTFAPDVWHVVCDVDVT
ncbi:uncharacterized protein LODBEIA_P33990 [Lodderomyces beijingensis]|uniref:tRNA wybutosine-synthesizing protein 2 n=1 Tax=Lodderomyces beijingensis TaxID=1775926 RepID=A0ABP0ZLZ7_9ASCO